MNARLLKRLNKLARKCATKKEISTHVKGAELAEAWRMKQIQNRRFEVREGYRYGNHASTYLIPEPLSRWDRRQIKRCAWKTTLRWRMAREFGWSFAAAIAAKIKSGWAYTWRGVDYGLSLRHSRNVSVEHSRSASSYDTFFTAITFDLLRQEGVWIGGLLTIRAKVDALKSEYPCHWFERRKDSPGLLLKQGMIVNGYHQEDGLSKATAIRNAIRKTKAELPKGWITRESSLKSGNCRAGTDGFIHNVLVPWWEDHGVTVGDLRGTAVLKKFLIQVAKERGSSSLSYIQRIR
jgi:hypothetical protein